jgi:hypothetical protein
VFSFGDIIEFKSSKEKGSTYVDRINEICAYDDGSVGYWTEIYPELAGEESEVGPERIIRVVEPSGNPPPKVPDFPFKRGQRILFRWDGKKMPDGTYQKIYRKEVIKKAHFILSKKDKNPPMRIDAGDCYICTEDDHEIEIIGESTNS